MDDERADILTFYPRTKTLLSVCPAGEDVIGPFQADRKGFVKETLRPLQEKETVYIVPGSDAEGYVAKKFPHKTAKKVRGSLLPAPSPGS